jgi:hypothetical protein
MEAKVAEAAERMVIYIRVSTDEQVEHGFSIPK